MIAALLALLVAPAAAQNAPEISTSPGEKGGVVVFWPRVVPKTQDPSLRAIAGVLQERLKAITERAVPGKPLDVRPEPERVCGQAGCKAMTVGVLLYHTGEACIVAGLVAGSGKADTRIVPWVGDLVVQQPSVPFREPPESALGVKDWGRCDAVLSSLDAHEADLEALIREVAAAD